MTPLLKTIAVAPMMDYTDRHFRYLLRLISPNCLLYTEMMTTGAILHGQRERFLQYDPAEHPVAIQLGGSDPAALAECARICEQYGYDEINLNVGCPSDRVQNGQFGACLMKQPELVACCVAAMKNAVKIPVTVKTRIGVDGLDSYDYLKNFVQQLMDAGCSTLIVHARKAWLQGLSPKENREIPPLCYDTVYQLKKDFPQLPIIVNGGIKTLAHIQQHLLHTDGIMIGREICNNPYFLAEIEQEIFHSENILVRQEVVEQFLHYVVQQIKQNTPPKRTLRHLLNLYHGVLGARTWRRRLTEFMHANHSQPELLHTLQAVIADASPSGSPAFAEDDVPMRC